MNPNVAGHLSASSETRHVALRSLTLRNWKSFTKATLNLAELTVLIGANASGKSNALEALKLLGWMARGGRLGGIQQARRDEELGLRGALTDLPPRGQSATEVSFECEFESGDPEVGELRLSTSLTISGMAARITAETLDAPRLDTKLPLYRIVDSFEDISNIIAVEYNNFKRGGKKPQIPCVDNQAVFTQLTTPARFGAGQEKAQTMIPRAAEAVRLALDAMLFLDPSPSAMRGYADRMDQQLRGDGSNVSSVLHHLCQDDASRSKLLAFIQDLPEQDVTDIAFLETPRAEVMVQLQETFGGKARLCDAPLLSDGTLRVLSIAAALLSVPQGTLVIIEELDNGIHPSRAARLLKRIQEVADERGLRILLTTHNPALLDSLPTTAIAHVTVCFRDPDSGSSKLVRLSELHRYPNLLARGPLGQLLTQGVIDRYVKTDEHEDERIRQGLSWVDSLRGAEAEG